MDLKSIHGKFTQIVASNLHHQDRTGSPTIQPMTASEITESFDGWVLRYHSEVPFRLRIDHITALLMTALIDAQESSRD